MPPPGRAAWGGPPPFATPLFKPQRHAADKWYIQAKALRLVYTTSWAELNVSSFY